MIDVTPMTVIDLTWAYIDPQGHEHRWRPTHAQGEPPSGDLPTLQWIVDIEGEEFFDEDGYEDYAPEVGHYECLQCGAVVEPRTKGNDQRYFMAGLMSAYVNGEPASRAQVETLLRRNGIDI